MVLAASGGPTNYIMRNNMTALDILSDHLGLSVDELGYLLDQWNDIAYRLECNMDELLEDHMGTELSLNQIEMVGSGYKMIPAQTPLSLLIDRLGGGSEFFMKHILMNIGSVSSEMGFSIQDWYEDHADEELSPEWFDLPVEEVKAALLTKEETAAQLADIASHSWR